MKQEKNDILKNFDKLMNMPKKEINEVYLTKLEYNILLKHGYIKIKNRTPVYQGRKIIIY